ncbi:MAG: hypothetical protein JWM68_1002 [Verrucomicrobiales bacterium]|nr:hypothetical protein [Verrucomicrobiales bacterium]
MNAKRISRDSTKLLFVVWIALTFQALPVRAWNNVGHRTIAELVWRKLDKDERQAVSDLLKQHPHYKSILTADVPRGVDKNEWAFLMAANWPDMVRPAKHGQRSKPHSVTKYDLYPHAIGYPFMLSRDTNRVSLEDFYIAKPDAEMVLSNSFANLKNVKATASDRAVSLCWALHLCGDLHQPLHAANLVTKKRPRGDSLGGHHIVRVEGERQIDLHSFWDQLPGVNPSYQTAAALADELNAAPELKPQKLKDLEQHKTIASWVQESFHLAVDFAYAEDRMQFVHEEDVESGKIPTSAIPTLSEDFIKDARKIARQRLVLAAERIALELKQTW